MNIEKRKIILETSLIIENLLSDILMNMMEIKDSNNKSLSHKTSALSFKNKTDLLYDIDKIDKKLYDRLVMFMEIRNQFIHNLSSDSYEIVLDRVQKRNHILRLDNRLADLLKDNDDSEKKEEVYKIAFSTLAHEIIDKLEKLRIKILEEKIEKIKVEKDALKLESYNEVLTILAEAIDEFADFYNNHLQKSFNSDTDYGDTIRYGIRAIFENKMKDKKSVES